MPDFISQNKEFILVALFFLFFIWNIALEMRLDSQKKRTQFFFKGKKAEDLEGVLSETLKRQRDFEVGANELLKRIEKLENIGLRSVQKVGIVRFNPFSEIGGNQSFSLALLDQKDDGLVILAYHSKEGTRVYAKPIKQGESSYALTGEEEEAIKKAMSNE